MLTPLGLQVAALLTYGWLVACLVWGRPNRQAVTGPSATGTTPAGVPRSLEVVWLGSLAILFGYPLVALIAPDVLLSFPWAVGFPGEITIELLGLAVILVGGALVGWAFRSLGRFATVEIRLSADHEVVRSGPYGWIRHPMYTANIALGLGITLTFLALPLLLPLALVVWLADRRARSEERLFLASDRLGADYRRYVGATGRFLPLSVHPYRSGA